jgi:hypothetical protein
MLGAGLAFTITIIHHIMNLMPEIERARIT